MTTKDEAATIIQKRLDSSEFQEPGLSVFVVTKVEERGNGWLVFYDSRKHVESQNILDALAGNAPFLVCRLDGRVFETRTAGFTESLRKAEKELDAHVNQLHHKET